VFPESGITVEFDMPENLSSFGYNPEMVIRMDPSKLEALGWKATIDLEDMFRRMVKSFE
jgi:nucleoside-diphosphate-sugar epimerase